MNTIRRKERNDASDVHDARRVFRRKEVAVTKTRTTVAKMRARCQRRLAWLLRCFGAAGVIVVCAGSLALAGSPQLHERIDHHGARLIHSCAIGVSKAGKCPRAIETCARALVRRTPTAILPAPWTNLPLVWVPKLFLETCRFEHGPPVLC